MAAGQPGDGLALKAAPTPRPRARSAGVRVVVREIEGYGYPRARGAGVRDRVDHRDYIASPLRPGAAARCHTASVASRLASRARLAAGPFGPPAYGFSAFPTARLRLTPVGLSSTTPPPFSQVGSAQPRAAMGCWAERGAPVVCPCRRPEQRLMLRPHPSLPSWAEAEW